MKNLTLTSAINYQLSTNRKLEKFCVEFQSGNVFLYANGIISKLSIHSGEENVSTSLAVCFENKEKIPSLIGMNYLESSEAVSFIFEEGSIYLYTPGINNLECVGLVPTGIKAISWSPDEEVFALVTGEENVIVMNSTFDPVSETFLHQNDTGEKQFMTVGWGKKETQFHGSEGKSAAKVTPLQCGPVFEWDDRRPYISWKGDGELFVVSTVNPDANHRQLRFFNREGVLQCISETVDGLEGPVCWKPSGSLVAAVQRLPNKHMIIFFEKNGLRHGEFIMPFKPQEMLVKKLSWNIDSTLLAVCCERLSDDGEAGGFLQLWAVNNYHWYLKNVLSYDPYGKFINFMWDINHAYRLHLLCEGSVYACHDFVWTVNHSKGKTEDDNACVAVVDGDKLLVTPFRQTVIPPPMSAYTIHCPLPISDVVFASFDTGDNVSHLEKPDQISGSFFNNFFVVLADNSIIIFTLCDDMITEHVLNDASTVHITKTGAAEYKNTTKFHCPVGRFVLDWDNAPEELGKDFRKFILRHWKWVTEKLVFCCITNGRDTCVFVLELSDSSSGESEIGKLSIRSSVCLLGSVVTVATSHKKDMSSAIMQLHDGNLMRYDFFTGCMSNFKNSNGQPLESLPVFVKMEVCNISGEEFLFGLTSKNRFYVNDVEVLSDCSSFFVQSEYLLLTTYCHTLMNILLTRNNIERLGSKKWDPSSTEDIRRVERGSRLVVAVAKHFKVILQMPRGNLECIHPRALSLYIVADLVKRRKYDKAFDIIRTQRIDLNVLCDLNPLEFVSHLNEFVLLVKNPNWISLFLCELKAENVFETLYSGLAYLQIERRNHLKNKLHMICDGLREAMESVDESKYFLPILTSYVMKKTDEDLISALKRVRSIKEKAEIAKDEALKYLIYLVEVETLYVAALRIYDFDLVMMIAAKSSKDPKEYVPFINGLQKLEKNYQHYKVDLHLKSYSSALKNIAKCGEECFDECLNLIKSHNLYSEALKLFPRDGKFHRQICDLYADHLLENHCYEEAGILQKISQNYEKAIISFQKAGDWRQTLILAKDLNYNRSQMSQLCRELSSELKERRKFSDAAFILNEYLNDYEECVAALTDGCLWEEAIRISHQHDRLDLIDTHVKPGIKDHFSTMITRLNENNDSFTKYKTRLSVLRTEKLKAQEEKEVETVGEKEYDKNVGEDIVSEASSIIGSSFKSSSRGSSHTSRSGKNRRKHERKILSLKEGNPHEEVALVTALNELYKRTFSQETKDEVKGLCIMLVLYAYDDMASQLQDLLSNMQREMIRSKDEIWLVKEPQEHLQFGPLSTSNTISALAYSSSGSLFHHGTEIVHIPPVVNSDTSWKMKMLTS